MTFSFSLFFINFKISRESEIEGLLHKGTRNVVVNEGPEFPGSLAGTICSRGAGGNSIKKDMPHTVSSWPGNSVPLK